MSRLVRSSHTPHTRAAPATLRACSKTRHTPPWSSSQTRSRAKPESRACYRASSLMRRLPVLCIRWLHGIPGEGAVTFELQHLSKLETGSIESEGVVERSLAAWCLQAFCILLIRDVYTMRAETMCSRAAILDNTIGSVS